MALLNRFSKLNDRGETGIFTFIVTKSVTRDFHRDATTKDFCFGYHRWAISFQRPTEKVLGVHLLLRNPSPSTSCVVDFTLMLLNREHFSQNEVYTKRQAKFTITNPMQGVPRWIQMSDLSDRHFSNETGEFLFELSLSNMTTIFECDIQLSPAVLNQYKCLLKNGASSASQQLQAAEHQSNGRGKQATEPAASQQQQQPRKASGNEQLINLETNYFTFGAFDWSLTIVPLVNPSRADANQPQQQQQQQQADSASSGASSSSASSSAAAVANQQQQQAQASANHLLTPNRNLSSSSQSIASNSSQQVQHNNKAGAAAAKLEPVCRVYLNRLNGLDCLCRVKYRVILGHHQPAGSQHPSAQHVDSRVLDQISDSGGRIRGHQFRATNILKLISLRQSSSQADSTTSAAAAAASSPAAGAASGGQVPAPSQHHHSGSNNHHHSHHHHQHSASSTLDLRVHIEMFCANTISEARVPLQRKPNEAQASNCSDRNKQAWCVESDCESENVRLKLFFMDLQSVPRNHIRYISWVAYVVARDARQGRESLAVRNAPHSNYYLQDGIDMGTIMETDIAVKELTNPSGTRTYLDGNQLTVHIEWVDSLLLFSHLYNNYDSLATIQRHQMRRELSALQMEYELLERKYFQSKRSMSQLLSSGNSPSSSSQQLAPSGAPIAAQTGAQTTLPANAAADWSTSQHSIGCEQADNNAPATQPARHQPHRRKISPMSHAERLKFSSSTPPSRQLSAMQPQQPHPAGQTRQPNNSPSHLGATSEQHQQQQLDQPQGHGHGSARRRLPQQPLAAGPLVKTLEREWVAQRVCGTPPAHSRRDSQVSPSAGATYQQHMRASLGSLELGAGSVSLMPGNGAGAGGPSAHPLLDQRRVSPSDLAELAAPAPRRAHSTMGQLAHAACDPLAAYHHHLNHNHHQMDLHQANAYSADFIDPHRRTSHELYLHAADRPPFGEMDEADYLVRLQQQPDADENEGDELELEMQSLYVAAAGGGDNGSMRQGVALVDGEQILMSSTAAYYEQPDLARASSKQQLVVESSAASIVTQSRSSPQIERRMNIHLDEHQFDSHQYERHYELQ